MASSNRAEFGTLPNNIKKVIREILEHRKEVKKNGKRYALSVPLLEVAAIASAFEAVKSKETWWAALTVVLADFGAWGGVEAFKLLKEHSEQFRKEYLKLHRRLIEKKDSPAIGKLLEKYPYFKVNWKGDLVGKKRAPSIFRIPIGRRRIASLKAGKETIRKWKKNYLPKIRKKRRKK